MALIPDSSPAKSGWGSLRQLTRYQWFVFIVACLAWDLDCMDQQLFNVARNPAMSDLVPRVQPDDPRLPDLAAKLTQESKKNDKPPPTEEMVIAAQFNGDVGKWAGRTTSVLLRRWAGAGSGSWGIDLAGFAPSC